MLGVALSDRPTPVPGAVGLAAMNIDPNAAAESYRTRVIAQMGRQLRRRSARQFGSNSPAPARPRSPPLTSLSAYWLTRRPNTTMSSLTPLPPDTPCACSASRRHGPGF
jgi:hypothetical protein